MLLFSLGPLFAQTVPPKEEAPVPITGSIASPGFQSDIATLKKTVAFLTVWYNDGTGAKVDKGTGFFVGYSDPRLPKGASFVYLISNKHLIQPGMQHGVKYPVSALQVQLNEKQADGTLLSRSGSLPLADWVFPQNEADDLAALPIVPDQNRFDYVVYADTFFATRDVIAAQHITEGASLLLTGFFYQFSGEVRTQPIVREGTLAMLPDEPLLTTLGARGNLYLADAHVFGGNSGSPVFVDIGGMRNGALMFVSHPYRLLGVASGYMNETPGSQLAAVTDTESGGSNSGIATIVPADALRSLLDSPELQKARDKAVERLPAQPSAGSK